MARVAAPSEGLGAPQPGVVEAGGPGGCDHLAVGAELGEGAPTSCSHRFHVRP